MSQDCDLIANAISRMWRSLWRRKKRDHDTEDIKHTVPTAATSASVSITATVAVALVAFLVGVISGAFHSPHSDHPCRHYDSNNADSTLLSLPSSSPAAICPRAAVFHFAPNGAGMCSHLNTLIGALIVASLTEHRAFVDDHQFNYGRYEWYFRPWPRHGLAPVIDSGQQFVHAERERHDVVWTLEPDSSSVVAAPPSAVSLTGNGSSPAAASAECDQPHALTLSHAVWHATNTSALAIPMLWNLSHADFATPGLYQNPLVAPLKVRTADSRTDMGSLYMLARRRFLRSVVQPLQSIKAMARSWLHRENLCTKSSIGTGARFIAVHMRRGDKLKSLGVKGNVDTSQAYMRVISKLLKQLRADTAAPAFSPSPVTSSWSRPADLTHHTDELRGLCEASDEFRSADFIQPHIVLVSDDRASYAAMSRLAPCWRWHFPFHESAARSGHDQERFDTLPMIERHSHSQQFLAQLLLLAHADFAVVSFTSNVGRLVAALRGHRDVYEEQRVVSVDIEWKEY